MYGEYRYSMHLPPHFDPFVREGRERPDSGWRMNAIGSEDAAA